MFHPEANLLLLIGGFIVVKLPIQFWILTYVRNYYEEVRDWRVLGSVLLTSADAILFVLPEILGKFPSANVEGLKVYHLFPLKVIYWLFFLFLLVRTNIKEKDKVSDKLSSTVIYSLFSTVADFFAFVWVGFLSVFFGML